MGKKSKRKSNNKPAPCYHGCTKKEFNNCGKHQQILEDWDNKVDIAWDEFYDKNKHFMSDPTFGRFVIARITADFLEGTDDTILLYRLLLLLEIRYCYIPRQEGKDVGPESEINKNYSKYSRDIQTISKRGRINCIAREIPCDCMDAKRIEAKAMAKVAVCYECGKEFPKEKMLRCLGCDHVQYCSKECGIKHWPIHKATCIVASASASAPISVPSFGETIDVDVDADVDAEEEKNNNDRMYNTTAISNTNKNTNTQIQTYKCQL